MELAKISKQMDFEAGKAVDHAIAVDIADVEGEAPSTSRHSAMASRTRSTNLSSERACVWHPLNAGTVAT